MTADVYEPHPTRADATAVEGTFPDACAPDTTSPDTTSPHATGPDATGEGHTGWQAQLRDRGYRLTPQRQLVLEAVGRLGHATPETIAAEVRRTARGVNISTVYRTLDLLEDLGLVWHVHLTHGAPTYHVAGQHRHIHLVCGSCGAIDEISPDRLTGLVGELRQEIGFQVDVDHVALTGRCADCSAATRG